ncbi:calcium-binding protein, partial [Phenylobacterium sp.]|uniref:calcium-binding protein n=1 Tax=Phenylobacterium sp. TaxID=1871053 RepID=UPI002FE0F803
TGHAGANNLQGGAGADRLVGQGGDDRLVGGAGDDVLDGGTGANDFAAFELPTGTTGSLRVVETAQAGVFNVELVNDNVGVAVFRVTVTGQGAATVEGLGDHAWQGTDTVANIDQLHFMVPPFNQGQFATLNLTPRFNPPQNGVAFAGGTPLGEVMDLGQAYSGLPADVVRAANGQQGDDTLQGGGFVDDLNGGAGNDSVQTGAGHDALRGADGNDTLSAGADDDYLSGGAGDDVMDGGDGFDRVSLYSETQGVKADLAVSGPQDTGLGMDVLTNVEHVSGGEMSDTLSGDDQANWLWGSGGGDDVLDGRGGDDLLMVAAGGHSLTGGAGTDTVAVTVATAGADISLAEQGAAQDTGIGSMTLSGIENLSGSAHADTLTGDADANVLAGNSGDDRLVGAAGNDLLLGDGAVDIDGNAGGPIATFDDVADFDLAGGNDDLQGGAGADTLKGGTGDDTLTGGADADTLVGGAGSDTAVFTGARADYAVTANPDGSLTLTDLRNGAPDGVDVVHAVESFRFSDVTLSANDLGAVQAPQGTTGNDTLNGGPGADTLDGLAGDDRLTGHGGSDRIDGSTGHDIAGFGLPEGTAGSLRAVAGAGADLGKILVQLVDGNTVTDVFRITVTDGDAVVEGLGPVANLGTDTVTDVEELHFYIPAQNPTPGQFVGLNLTVNAGQVSGGFAFVRGSVDGDLIQLGTL